jgi:molecular chaperone GrpE
MTEEQDQTLPPTEEEQVEPPDGAEQEDATSEVTEDDESAALRQELADARAKEAEYLDGWQRARAELANARKRFERERLQAYDNAKVDVFSQVLPVADDFERAMDSLPDDLSNLTWIEGITLVQRKLQLLLERASVDPIEAVGHEFDPFSHEAVTHEPSETVPAGHVIAEMQKGYKMGDRVLRPAVVRVSSGPLPEPEADGSEAGQVTEETTESDSKQT